MLIGAPPLVALASSLALLALLFCALFIPGFVRPAEADTTSSTRSAPVIPGPADSQQAEPSSTDQEATQPFTTDQEAAPPSPTEPSSSDAAPAPAERIEPIEPAPGRELVTLPWGYGDGRVGLAQPAEGLTRGPEALAVASDGRLAVLDSVNSRVVFLTATGSYAGAVPLALAGPRFLAVDDARVYVLDADIDGRLVCLDWQGVIAEEIQLPPLDDVVTGMFATADGPCVEIAHNDVFLVDGKDGGEQTSPGGGRARAKSPMTGALRATSGRPLGGDLAKTAKITFQPKAGIQLKRFKVDKKSLKATQVQACSPKFAGGRAIEHLVSVDSDGRGGLIVGARLLQAKGAGSATPALVVGRLAANAGTAGGAPTLADALALNDLSFAYLGQPYVVAPDGRIYQPVGTERGYSIVVHALPGASSSQATTAGPSGPTNLDIEEARP